MLGTCIFSTEAKSVDHIIFILLILIVLKSGQSSINSNGYDINLNKSTIVLWGSYYNCQKNRRFMHVGCFLLYYEVNLNFLITILVSLSLSFFK